MVPLVRARKARYFPVLVCHNVLRPLLLLRTPVEDGWRAAQESSTNPYTLTPS